MAMTILAKGCCAVWFILLGVFWLMWVSLCFKKVQFYLMYTKSTSYLEVNNGRGLPVITICNLNAVRLNAFNSSDIYNAGQLYGILDENMELVDSLADYEDLKAKATFSDETKRAPFNLEEFQKRAAHKIDEIWRLCKYSSRPCSARNFSPILTDMGLCYQFNWMGWQMADKTGSKHALQLLLATQQEDYLPPRKNDPFAAWDSAGYTIAIHEPGTPPEMSNFGLELSAGFKTSIEFEQTKVNLLPAPYGTCVTGNSMVQNYSCYSAVACNVECKTQHIMEECECRMPYMPRINSMGHRNSVCSPSKVISCAKDRLTKLDDSDTCGRFSCPENCNSNRYTPRASMTKLADPSPVEQPSGEMVSASIYFKSLTKCLTEYPAYTTVSLLGDIGYPFSILLGATVFTIMEIGPTTQ